MTAATVRPLLSVEQWRALGEDTSSHAELQEGVLIVSPRPRPEHQDAVLALGSQLRLQVPRGMRVSPEIDIVIDSRFPATVRVPDLVVRRVSDERPVPASQVVLAVEVLSPGTRRVDLVMKRSEYADAGIPHYWIVDLDGAQVRLEVLTLVDGAYRSVTATGEYAATVPFDVRLDLTALV